MHVLVVGAGVTGLLAALGCARAGHRVTVLERGGIPNPGSSSYDQHRAIRALDPDDAESTRRGALTQRRWSELEALLEARFYRRVGVVTGSPAGDVDAALATAAGAGLRVDVITPDKLPHITFPAGSVGIRELDAGVLLAERVLWALARWLERHPTVTLRSRCAVASVDADRGRVVLADGTVLGADLVVLATGPWSRDLVDRPMVLYRQTMVYLRPPANLVNWWENAPSAGRIGADGRGWLVPPGPDTMLKISTDAVCREVDSPHGNAAAEHRYAAQVMGASILTDSDAYTIVAVKHCHYLDDTATGGGSLIRIGPAGWARAASGGDGFRSAALVADRIVDIAAGIPA